MLLAEGWLNARLYRVMPESMIISIIQIITVITFIVVVITYFILLDQAITVYLVVGELCTRKVSASNKLPNPRESKGS